MDFLTVEGLIKQEEQKKKKEVELNEKYNLLPFLQIKL